MAARGVRLGEQDVVLLWAQASGVHGVLNAEEHIGGVYGVLGMFRPVREELVAVDALGHRAVHRG